MNPKIHSRSVLQQLTGARTEVRNRIEYGDAWLLQVRVPLRCMLFHSRIDFTRGRAYNCGLYVVMCLRNESNDVTTCLLLVGFLKRTAPEEGNMNMHITPSIGQAIGAA